MNEICEITATRKETIYTFHVMPDQINSERDYGIGGFIGSAEIYGLNFVASPVERVLILPHVYSYITFRLR